MIADRAVRRPLAPQTCGRLNREKWIGEGKRGKKEGEKRGKRDGTVCGPIRFLLKKNKLRPIGTYKNTTLVRVDDSIHHIYAWDKTNWL